MHQCFFVESSEMTPVGSAYKRLQYERDLSTRPNQSGLWPWRGCTDQMHNLRHILEQRWSFQQATVMCFVDFASPFDSVDRDSVWQTMVADEMPPTLLGLIKAYYSSTKMKVRASGSDSVPLEIRSGVRQGCALSPTFFNNIIDWILRQALQDYPRVKVHVSDLTYADDSEIQGWSWKPSKVVFCVYHGAHGAGIA